MWSESATGTAKKNFKISRLTGWPGIYDWEDREDWDDRPFWSHRPWGRDTGPPTVAEPAGDVPAGETEEERLFAEEPAGADESSPSTP